MKKILFLLFGITCYVIFLVTAFYAIGFAGNFMLPRTMDGSSQAPLASALLINASLLLLLVLQYRIIAGSSFKQWWMRILPRGLWRSSSVLLVSLCLLFLMWQWQPIGGIVWSVEDKVAQVILQIAYLSGWCIVFISTFLISHFDLFGLRQVWLYFRGKPNTPLPTRTPGLYRLVRHPFYMGSLLISWSAAVMTITHLLLAIVMTVYIVAVLQTEENDLIVLREKYARYKKWTPLLILFLKKRRAK